MLTSSSLAPSQVATLRWFLLSWLTALPVGLVTQIGWVAVPATSLIALLYLSLEEVAMAVETPFGTSRNDICIEEYLLLLERRLLDLMHRKLSEADGGTALLGSIMHANLMPTDNKPASMDANSPEPVPESSSRVSPIARVSVRRPSYVPPALLPRQPVRQSVRHDTVDVPPTVTEGTTSQEALLVGGKSQEALPKA